MIRDPIPANWTIERRIYRFPPLEGERKGEVASREVVTISIEARFSWPRATAHRVKGSLFCRSPFAFDFVRFDSARSPKTGPSGCAIGRQGSPVFPRNVCTMTRRMPLVHFHRRPRAHARTHVLERARSPLKSGRKKAVEIPIRARLRDGHLGDCCIRTCKEVFLRF